MYSVSWIQERDVEDVMKFMKRTFFIDEPLYKGVGYCNSEHDDTPDLDAFCREALPGISFMAKDDDDNIVATLICGISPIVNPTDFLSALKNCKCPKYKKVIQMMILREVIMEIWNIYPEEKQVFEIKMASTDSKWRNKGIMNKLMKEAENAAKKLNIRVLRIETSSAFSAKSAERHGFKCVFSRIYTDFMLDGKPLIVTEPPHLEDRPGVNLHELKNCRSTKYKKFIQMMFLREMLLEIWNIYPNDDRVFEIKLACTDPKWRKKGIMNELMKEAENAAKALNIRLLRIDTTSAYSAKSAESMGYKLCVFSRLNKDIILDGIPLIVPEPPHLEDKVFVKELY